MDNASPNSSPTGLASLPNTITILRMISVAPLAWLLWKQHYSMGLVVAFVAGASDAVDGFLAKRFGWTSRLGGLLDPLADKLMLVACFLVLTLQGLFPMWLLLLILARDVLIVAGATAYHFLIRPVQAEPSVVSKVNTFLQIALVLWVLLDLAWLRLPQVGTDVLIYLVAATTLISGIHYVLRWSRLAQQGRSRGGRS